MKHLQVCCSVTQSFMSDSLQPHELQHARLPCPSPSPRVCSNSCPLSQWCHPTISSSVAPFSSCPQSFPASGSFPVSWLFASGGQSIGASVSAWVLPIQGWFPLRLTGLISLLSKGLSRVFSNNSKASVLQHSAFSQLSHPNMTTGKTIALTTQTFIGKITSLLFNMLSVCHSFSSKEEFIALNFLIYLSLCYYIRKFSLLCLFPNVSWIKLPCAIIVVLKWNIVKLYPFIQVK